MFVCLSRVCFFCCSLFDSLLLIVVVFFFFFGGGEGGGREERVLSKNIISLLFLLHFSRGKLAREGPTKCKEWNGQWRTMGGPTKRFLEETQLVINRYKHRVCNVLHECEHCFIKKKLQVAC